VRNQIIADRGSVQKVASIPKDIKELYKTVWEIKQKAIIDQAADRGAFICQSQSLNIHMGEPTTARLTSMHFYAWKRGLKTGMYYLRSLPKADAIQFTVDQAALTATRAASAPAAGGKPAATTTGATKGLAFEEEPACESCSA
jgi:ribonucleotide reductase alpha subunit